MTSTADNSTEAGRVLEIKNLNRGIQRKINENRIMREELTNVQVEYSNYKCAVQLEIEARDNQLQEHEAAASAKERP